MVDSKLNKIKQEVADLADHCQDVGDEKTRQLLLEVSELLEITHDTFLGRALNGISQSMLDKHQKH